MSSKKAENAPLSDINASQIALQARLMENLGLTTLVYSAYTLNRHYHVKTPCCTSMQQGVFSKSKLC